MVRFLSLLTVVATLFFGCGENQQDTDHLPPQDSGVDMRGRDTANMPDTTVADTTAMQSTEGEERKIEEPMEENVGPIYIGMSEGKVVEALGEPAEKTTFEMWDADGAEHQDWEYPGKGLTVGMWRGDDKKVTVDRITLSSKSTLKTARKIGIGSSREDVKSAYIDDIDPESDPLDEEQIVVGSLFGGIIFTMKDQKVANIFVGAAAE
ncbi:MAG: hypothetical protein KDD67_15445 [Ignavibacteriae bacterium]|nr:hypothetical protein [Ignavibacteriota bacterium]MCB9215783.1 hypothetical protein [Ignavibacteria bacterium]